jgi:hypothetical protein
MKFLHHSESVLYNAKKFSKDIGPSFMIGTKIEIE